MPFLLETQTHNLAAHAMAWSGWWISGGRCCYFRGKSSHCGNSTGTSFHHWKWKNKVTIFNSTLNSQYEDTNKQQIGCADSSLVALSNLDTLICRYMYESQNWPQIHTVSIPGAQFLSSRWLLPSIALVLSCLYQKNCPLCLSSSQKRPEL